MAIDDGGPVIRAGGETDYGTDTVDVWVEINLRDDFAKHAMAALIHGGPKDHTADEGCITLLRPAWLAKCAYELADAMLAARKEASTDE